MNDLAFDVLSPPHIAYGWGRFSEVGALAATLGRRAFVLSGSRTLEASGVLDQLVASLRAAGVEALRVGSIHREPEVEDVDRVLSSLRDAGAGDGDLTIAIGGGSAIDLAKAAGALVTQDDQDSQYSGAGVVDFLEGLGKGMKITRPPLPQLAIPTTSGTGAEATKNAVISSYSPAFKKSLRSDQMVPRIVLADPELTVSVPATTTAYTGMDAITQLIESYISSRARPLPRALSLQGLELAVSGETPAIVRAVEDGRDRDARERMMIAALYSGIALANSGLGLAHGVAPALGVHCRVAHGLACAVMLPSALRVNRDVRKSEIARLAVAMTGRQFPRDDEAVDAAIETIESICRAVAIPSRLSEIGVRREQIVDLVPSSRGNSMSGNPRELSDDELRALLEEMY